MVDLPRSRRYEAPVLTSEGARAVLAAVEGDRIGPVVVVTLATGMRQGEALGLRWSDVDLDADQLTIRQTLQRAGKRPVYAEPKTSRSRRTIVLPAAAVAALRAQRSRQLHERLLAGSRWQNSGLVFTSSIGTPMMPGDLTKRLQRLVADAGLPRLRYHDLRHGTASLLTAQGIHPRTIMEILGHSTIAVTMNTYAHVAPALQREAASSLDVVLGSA
jgi:integrase